MSIGGQVPPISGGTWFLAHFSRLEELEALKVGEWYKQRTIASEKEVKDVNFVFI